MGETPQILWQTPVVSRYLEAVREQHRYIDARGVMQVVREVKLAIDDAFVSMRVSIERPFDSLSRYAMADIELAPPGLESPRTHRGLGQQLGRERADSPSIINADSLLGQGSCWFILGDPGGGKTTLLRRMAYRVAADALQGDLRQLRLPLFVPLRYLSLEWNQHPKWQVDEAIVEYFCGPGLDEVIKVTDAERAAWREALLMALSSGLAVLLCDGLDEQRDAAARHASEQALHAVLNRSPRVVCLISSRVVGFDSGPLRDSFSVAKLQPFNERQTEEFFTKWMLAVERADDMGDDSVVAGRAQRRTRQLMSQMRANPGVLTLASNPLMCAIIGLIFRQGAVLPEMRGELYKLCVDTFVFNWEINKQRAGDGAVHLRADETQAVLEAIALDFQERPSGNVATREKLLELAGDFAEREFGLAGDEARQRADRLLELVVKVAGLLIERSPGHFGFFHLTLQEYLAGRAIARRRSEMARQVARHWLDTRWRETLKLAGAHQAGKGREEGEEYLELLLSQTHPHDKVMHYSLRLAIECAGDMRVGPQLADRVLLLWDEAWRMYPARRAALERSLSVSQGRIQAGGETLRRLAAQWFGGDAMSKAHACRVVATLSDPRLLDPLLAAMRGGDMGVRRAAAQALGKLADSRAFDALLMALRDEDDEMQQVAARAIGGMADEPAFDALLAALGDGNKKVREAAAWGLCGLPDLRAFDALSLALRDKNDRVRAAASHALSLLPGSRTLDALLLALRDADPGVRSAAAIGLVNLADPRAFDALLSAMNDTDVSTRRAATRALGALGDLRALDALLAALHDSESSVRWLAAEALGSLGDVRALEALLVALRDEGVFVRFGAASALGRLGSVRALDALLTMLREENIGLRAAAAAALGALGDSRAVNPLFVALRGNEKIVRLAAARALGRLADPIALEPLLAALRDGDEDVRQMASDALRGDHWIGMLSPAQSEALWPLASDPVTGEAAAQLVEAIDLREFVKANP